MEYYFTYGWPLAKNDNCRPLQHCCTVVSNMVIIISLLKYYVWNYVLETTAAGWAIFTDFFLRGLHIILRVMLYFQGNVSNKRYIVI